MALKPKRVDTIGPFHELYEQLKNHPIAVVISVICAAFLGIITSGYLCITVNHMVTSVSSSVRKTTLSFQNVLEAGLFKWWLATIILFFVYVFLIFKFYRSILKTYKKDYDDNYLKSKNNTYGGAHFQTREELETNCNFYDKIEETTDDILGTYDDQIVTLKLFGFTGGANRTSLIYGPPGSGKTTTIVKTDIYQGIRRGESLIVVDSKGSVYNQTSAVARKAGYVVRVLNLKPKELKNSDGFDLFSSIDPDDPAIDTQADVITKILLDNSQTNPNSDYQPGNYWYDNDFNIIKMVIMMVATDPKFIKQKKNNLAGVYDYLVNAKPETIAKDLECYDKDSTIYQCFNIFNAIKDERIKGQIMNGASNRIAKLGNPLVKKVVSNNEIDTTLPMQKKCIYYVVIPDQDNTYRFLSSLFFTRIFNDLCDYHDTLPTAEKKAHRPVHFILDECKATGGIMKLEDKIATVRERKISLTLIFQNSTQLNMLYGEEAAETIKECCYIKALLGAGGIKTTTEFEQLLGPQTIVTESLRYNEDTADILHAHGEMMKTITENERPLMYATDMFNGGLTRDEVLFVIFGMPPIRLKKYFAEKNGVPIHPMEALGMQLPEKLTSRHKPKWRYLEEQAAKENASIVLQRNVTVDENGEVVSKKPDNSADDIFGYTEE